MRVLFKSLLLQKALTKGIEEQVEQVSDKLLAEVKRRSPVRSGLFKNSWRMKGSGTKRTISNPQPYGHALEHGRSSQARDGVVGPSLRTIRK
jgi:hypothetical protein